MFFKCLLNVLVSLGSLVSTNDTKVTVNYHLIRFDFDLRELLLLIIWMARDPLNMRGSNRPNRMSTKR